MSSRRVAIAATALALVWLAMLTLGAGPVDVSLLRLLYAGDRPLLLTVARAFTFLGEPAVLVTLGVLAAMWLIAKRSWRYGLAVLAVTLVGRGLVEAQKYGIERLRPASEAYLVPVNSPSFPSGHAANSMIVYLTLALALGPTRGRRWEWPAVAAALALSLCIGASRVMLGVHWPSDVVGGWAFGLLWVTLALPLAERLAR